MKKLIVITTLVLFAIGANSTVKANGRGPKKSACPCDLWSPVLWAGWDGPGCYIIDNSLPEYSVQLFSTDDGSIPQVFLIYNGSDDNICTTFSDLGVVDNEFEVTDEEFAACEAETNQLAIVLGKIDGCALP